MLLQFIYFNSTDLLKWCDCVNVIRPAPSTDVVPFPNSSDDNIISNAPLVNNADNDHACLSGDITVHLFHLTNNNHESVRGKTIHKHLLSSVKNQDQTHAQLHLQSNVSCHIPSLLISCTMHWISI